VPEKDVEALHELAAEILEEGEVEEEKVKAELVEE
jgi:hypothetical protein